MAWFREVAHGRGQGFDVPPALTWAELSHWATLMATTPRPWELRVLLHIDNLWCAAWRKGRPGDRNKPQKPT